MRFNVSIWIAVFFLNTYAISDNNGLDLNEQNSFFSSSKIQIQVFSPFLTHSVFLRGEKGLSASYSYPGFFNGYTGQFDLYYTTSTRDSYNFGIGLFNIHIGANKKLLRFGEKHVYLNGMYGISRIEFPKKEFSFASLGVSSIIPEIKKNFNMEIALDGFIHSGNDGDFTPFVPYTRGLTLLTLFSHEFNTVIIGYGVGFGIIQYRYDDNEYQIYKNSQNDYDPEYYITYQREIADVDEIHSEIKAKWDTHIIIPFGLSLSYKF